MPSQRPVRDGERYDHIVVGAGSAGCVLANRLSAGGGRVLLLEAGGWDRDFWIATPIGFGKIYRERLHDWGYMGEPEPNVGGRRVECARGRVVGGSSSINAMAYVRGHRADFDRWAAGGLSGWSYADVLPYFRRQESWAKGADLYRGDCGPLSVIESAYDDPLADAYLAAAQDAGHPVTPDYNGAEQEGLGRPQFTIRDGRRCSAAVAYLRPALARPNLDVVVGALAQRVLFRGDRALGVEYRRGSTRRVAMADGEVVLSAGVINTPQLLMLSGVGPADQLRPLSIPLVLANAAVGGNLCDHLYAPVAYRRRGTGTLHRAMRLDRIARSLLEARFRGTGFATDPPSGVLGFIKSDSANALPDTQLLFSAGPPDAGPYLWPGRSYVDGFFTRAVLLRPESRGRLALAGPDPTTPLRIHWNFLATDADRAAMRATVRCVRDIGRRTPLVPFIAEEQPPRARDDSDAALDAFIRERAMTVHHPLGTCRMGGADAVVDTELRVHGLRGLRVVDASVMPDMIGGNINAAVIMIAERASDLILGRALEPPVAAVAPVPASGG